jgi:hypothetical protein
MKEAFHLHADDFFIPMSRPVLAGDSKLEHSAFYLL